MQQWERIEVALAFCDKSGLYARHAAAVMASIFASTESRVCIHLFHDDMLIPENRAKLQGTTDAFNQEISFINVEERTRECILGEKQHSFPGAKGMHYRFLIPSIFDFDKIIYLDCDIIVNLDIAELWHTDLGGKAIAAVPERYGEANYPPGLKRWVRWRFAYDELVEIILSCMWQSKYCHQRTSNCTKHLRDKLVHNMTKGHLLGYPRRWQSILGQEKGPVSGKIHHENYTAIA